MSQGAGSSGGVGIRVPWDHLPENGTSLKARNLVNFSRQEGPDYDEEAAYRGAHRAHPASGGGVDSKDLNWPQAERIDVGELETRRLMAK